MLHSTGEPQHYEALKGALVASTVCCALSRALVPPPPAPRENAWMFPPPGAVPYWEALLAGVVFGALGSLLSFATSSTDKLMNWMVGRVRCYQTNTEFEGFCGRFAF
jgi:H+/Cl- antiporter ClcA